MPLATYSDLQTEIAAWLRRSDLSAEIPGFIALAEAQMNRRLRVRPMLARLAQTWSAEYQDLPADFLAEREVTVLDGGGAPRPIDYLAPDQIDISIRTNAPARPRFYGLYGAQIRLSPPPDKAYSGQLIYLQAIPALSNANPTNWMLQRHPDAYLYGALAQSAPYLRADERLQTWGTLFTTVLADIEAADRTGAAARLRPRAELQQRRPEWPI